MRVGGRERSFGELSFGAARVEQRVSFNWSEGVGKGSGSAHQ